MNRGLWFGRLFGINLYLDVNWFLIFLLVTWNLATGLLPAWHPDWSAGVRWALVGLLRRRDILKWLQLRSSLVLPEPRY